MRKKITSELRASGELMLHIAKEQIDSVIGAAELARKTMKSGGTVFIFGNGGSASQAQHIAAELVNRLRKTRRPLPAIALTTDSSILTSIANDTSFQNVFSRQIEALGRKGDLAWAISTSGRSRNVIKALETAKSLKLSTLGFAGKSGGRMTGITDRLITVPSSSTARVQEAHLTMAHIICELIEEDILAEESAKPRT